MELVDGYLKTVKLYLPRRHKKDIIAELADEIHSQVEEKEASLGRSLTEAEQESLLLQFGDPVAVAARYRQKRRSVTFGRELIGPEMFPYYMWILLINALVTIGWAVYAAVRHALNVPMMLVSIVIQFVIVTFVVAVIDYVRRKFPRDWLFPPVRMTPLLPVAKWRSISGLVLWTLFGIWWFLLPYCPFLYFGSASNLRFTPGFLVFHLPVTLLLVLGIGQRLANLFRPDWNWLPPVTRLIANLAGLVIVIFMLKAYPYVAVIDPTVDPSHDGHLSGIFNAVILWGFVASWLWIFFLMNVIANASMCRQHILRLAHGGKNKTRIA
jgi:hypothetical protein